MIVLVVFRIIFKSHIVSLKVVAKVGFDAYHVKVKKQ